MSTNAIERNRLEQIGRIIVDTAYHLAKDVGPGLLESVYEAVMARALTDRRLFVERQKPVPCKINGVIYEEVFRPDLIVEHCIVVEVKAVARLPIFCEAQVLTYLRILDYRLGFLINFGSPHIGQGIHRIVNKL
jgi:GxxExxY protein